MCLSSMTHNASQIMQACLLDFGGGTQGHLGGSSVTTGPVHGIKWNTILHVLSVLDELGHINAIILLRGTRGIKAGEPKMSVKIGQVPDNEGR